MTGEPTSIELEIREDILIIRLSKPEKYNPLSTTTLEKLENIIETYNNTGKILFLTGKGRLFSAGIDLFEVAESKTPEEASKPFKALGKVLNALLNYNAPTITYLNGPAIAGGGELALATDIIYASPTASLEWPEPKFTIAAPMLTALAGETGLPALAGFTLTGDKLTIEEAAKLGIVFKIVETEEEALREAERIAGLYKRGSQAYKLMLEELRRGKRLRLAGILPGLEELASSPGLLGAARAFVESRRKRRT